MVHYRSADTGGHRVFYREAGAPQSPAVLLLHGFPTSSHMFRDLIPLLADRYRIVAPDLPGFGNTVSPPRGQFDYTFDNLARVIGGFVETVGLGTLARTIHPYPTQAEAIKRVADAYNRTRLTPFVKGCSRSGWRGGARTWRRLPVYQFCCPPAPPRKSVGREAGKARYRIVLDAEF